MRLVNFGTGEITDRLTILSLKILHGTAAGAEVKHFVDEKHTLLVQIRTRTLNEKWFETALDLGAVNAALWYAEDELRSHRVAGSPSTAAQTLESVPRLLSVSEVAFRIQALNDQRAQLIEAINKQTGEHLGQEKV